VKKYFSQLRPLERRIAVGVMVLLFIVLNWVFVKPHFSDWGSLQNRLANARRDLARDQKVIAQSGTVQAQVKALEGQGEFVAPEDQAIYFTRTIESQRAASGVGIANYSRSVTHTNQFFTEQSQNITVIGNDAQIVDFLFKLGNGASMVRVRDLDLQPDAARLNLNANIKLVASYQKNAPAPKLNNLKSATVKAK
jgi:Tfp pilus assembly protein PilO